MAFLRFMERVSPTCVSADTCVSQVKRTNGAYSFEDAFDFQKR